MVEDADHVVCGGMNIFQGCIAQINDEGIFLIPLSVILSAAVVGFNHAGRIKAHILYGMILLHSSVIRNQATEIANNEIIYQ
nr:hypothetical protein [uncultured Ruminococcus sp.]